MKVKFSWKVQPESGHKVVKTFFAWFPVYILGGIVDGRKTEEIRWLTKVTVEYEYNRLAGIFMSGKYEPVKFIDDSNVDCQIFQSRRSKLSKILS